MYKSHLQGILQEYQCVKKAVPECLAVQFAAQLEYVNRHFQPGLSLLAWNSVDIEAFLHHVYKDITRFVLCFQCSFVQCNRLGDVSLA